MALLCWRINWTLSRSASSFVVAASGSIWGTERMADSMKQK